MADFRGIKRKAFSTTDNLNILKTYNEKCDKKKEKLKINRFSCIETANNCSKQM